MNTFEKAVQRLDEEITKMNEHIENIRESLDGRNMETTKYTKNTKKKEAI